MSFDPKGYVSFQTALSVHGLFDDLVRSVWIATVCGDRQRRVHGIGHVQWVGLPDDLMFGYGRGKEFDFPGWQVAEPEKALVDLLWRCESRGVAVPVHSLRLDEIDRNRLAVYAERAMVDVRRLEGG